MRRGVDGWIVMKKKRDKEGGLDGWSVMKEKKDEEGGGVDGV